MLLRPICIAFLLGLCLHGQARAQNLDADPEIEITSLSNVSLGSYGILSPEEAELPLDSWEGSGLEAVDQLMDRLLAEPVPQWQADLIRRLMSLRAFSPDMFLNDDAERSQHFLERRVALLLHARQPDAVAKMVEGVPVTMRTEAMDVLLAEAYLWRLQIGEACRIGVGGGALERYGSTFWKQLQLICQLVSGQKEKAQLSLAMMEESNAMPSGYILSGVQVLTGAPKAKPAPLPEAPSALEFALANRLKQEDWENAALRSLPDVALQIIAEHQRYPAPVKEQAAKLLVKRQGDMPEPIQETGREIQEHLLHETPMPSKQYGQLARLASIERVMDEKTAKALDKALRRDMRTLLVLAPPEPDRLQYLEAVQGNRSGEALLLLLVMLRDTPPDQLSPAVFHQLLQGVKMLGLNDEAERLAGVLRALVLNSRNGS